MSRSSRNILKKYSKQRRLPSKRALSLIMSIVMLMSLVVPIASTHQSDENIARAEQITTCAHTHTSDCEAVPSDHTCSAASGCQPVFPNKTIVVAAGHTHGDGCFSAEDDKICALAEHPDVTTEVPDTDAQPVSWNCGAATVLVCEHNDCVPADVCSVDPTVPADNIVTENNTTAPSSTLVPPNLQGRDFVMTAMSTREIRIVVAPREHLPVGHTFNPLTDVLVEENIDGQWHNVTAESNITYDNGGFDNNVIGGYIFSYEAWLIEDNDVFATTEKTVIVMEYAEDIFGASFEILDTNGDPVSTLDVGQSGALRLYYDFDSFVQYTDRWVTLRLPSELPGYQFCTSIQSTWWKDEGVESFDIVAPTTTRNTMHLKISNGQAWKGMFIIDIPIIHTVTQAIPDMLRADTTLSFSVESFHSLKKQPVPTDTPFRTESATVGITVHPQNSLVSSDLTGESQTVTRPSLPNSVSTGITKPSVMRSTSSVQLLVPVPAGLIPTTEEINGVISTTYEEIDGVRYFTSPIISLNTLWSPQVTGNVAVSGNLSVTPRFDNYTSIAPGTYSSGDNHIMKVELMLV